MKQTTTNIAFKEDPKVTSLTHLAPETALESDLLLEIITDWAFDLYREADNDLCLLSDALALLHHEGDGRYRYNENIYFVIDAVEREHKDNHSYDFEVFCVTDNVYDYSGEFDKFFNAVDNKKRKDRRNKP